MSGPNWVLVRVLAGGEAKRLTPLTSVRSKPAVAGERIGFEPDLDRRRFNVTDSGVVVVPMAPIRPDANLYE